MARWQFLYKTLKRYINGADSSCPHCGSKNTELVGTKYIILQLRRCVECYLMFRYPKDNEFINMEYYQKDYKDGPATEIPDDKNFQLLIDSSFKNTRMDFSKKIEIIKRIKPNGFVLDYGCSWGYSVWQLQRAGYQAMGFEISKPRARFGKERLGVKIIDSFGDINSLLNNSFDIIVTGDVLEHMPHLFTIFKDFYRLLKKDGILVIFVPNCTGYNNKKIFRVKKASAFGENHSLVFDKTFFKISLSKYGFEVRCFFYNDIANLLTLEEDKVDIFSDGLMVIARKKYEKTDST